MRFAAFLLLSFGLYGVHQAANAQVLFSENFDTGGCDIQSGEACDFNNDHYTPTTSYSKFVTTPTPPSGSYAAQYAGLSGTDERTPFNYAITFASPRSTIAVEWYEFFATGYSWPAISQKIFRLSADDSNGVQINVVSGFENTDIDLFIIETVGYEFWNVHGGPMPENSWQRMRISVSLNTTGNSDGFATLWRGDTIIAEVQGANFRQSTTGDWTTSWVGGNYSGSGTNLANDSLRYIDSITFYETEPEDWREGGEPEPATGSYQIEVCQ